MMAHFVLGRWRTTACVYVAKTHDAVLTVQVSKGGFYSLNFEEYVTKPINHLMQFHSAGFS